MKWTPEYRAAWRASRRQDANLYAAEYRVKNHSLIRESQAQWYADNAPAQRVRKSKYHRTIKGRLALLRNSAQRRGLEMTLTPGDYAQIIESKTCVYCGFSLPETGGGLDRINNAIGYVSENVVPCCRSCNMARGDSFSHEEMILLGKHMRAIKLARTTEHANGATSGSDAILG